MAKIKLKKDELSHLNGFVKKGSKSARAVTRARILLLSHNGKRDVEIEELLAVGRSTIWRVKNNYFDEGVEYALAERERPGQPAIYNDKKKAEIIAHACTAPPPGRKRWSTRLLAEELRKKNGFETINRESIRLVLKKVTPSHG